VKSEIKYIGKTLLIGNSVLVVGDLHLGYGGAMREGGNFVPENIFEGIVSDFEKIFKNKFVGEKEKLSKIILLGDLKHVFGKILWGEWDEAGKLLDYLSGKCEEMIIIKGNHDKIVEPIAKKKGVGVVDYYLWKEFAFVHGDRDFEEIYGKGIRFWVMGHAHPAVVLEEKKGVKREKYKCFLVGKFKGKGVIIVPSFFGVNDGSDPRDYDLGLAWKFKFNSFNVKIVDEESLDVLDFGRLGKL